MQAVQMKDKMDLLVDYIMKKCLWQFHSRAWDRERQNKNILGMTSQILCGEEVDTTTPESKCYWVDAVCLADAYQQRFPWINEMSKDEVKELMASVHERMDFLTFKASLNEELNDPHY